MLALMKQPTEQTYSEIAEILSQYREEVPGGHRPWPESIRKRVETLWRLGVRSAEISRRTGLPYYTVLQWRKSGTRFVELPVVVPAEKVSIATTPTLDPLSILLPGGVRIEGVSVDALLVMLPALGVGQ